MVANTVKKIRSYRLLIPLLILGAALLIANLLISSKSAAPARKLEEKSWTVTAQTLYQGDYSPQVRLFGKVESPQNTTLSASISAYVESLSAREGEFVRAGTILLKLDARDIALTLAQREADVRDAEARINAELARFSSDQTALELEQELLNLAQKSVKRFESLRSNNQVSVTTLDEKRQAAHQAALTVNARQLSLKDHANRLEQLKAQKLRAESLLAQARLDLERTNITAPFDGRIAKIHVSVNDRVQTNGPLLSLYSIEDLEVRAQIPSRYLAIIRDSLSLSSGQPLLASALIDGTRLKLLLTRLAGEVDSGRGGIDGLFDVIEGNHVLELGRPIELLLQLPEVTRIYSVPTQSLFGSNRIYLIENDRLKGLNVERLGDWQDENGQSFVLIRSSNIQDGDILMSVQLPNAIPGLKVKPVLTP